MDREKIERIHAIGEEIAEIMATPRPELIARQEERSRLVRELQDRGWSLQQIGDELGVTRSRVLQLRDGQPSNAERQRRAKARKHHE
jgi:hypothetical protein